MDVMVRVGDEDQELDQATVAPGWLWGSEKCEGLRRWWWTLREASTICPANVSIKSTRLRSGRYLAGLSALMLPRGV